MKKITDKERLNWLIRHRGEVSFYDKVWWVTARISQGDSTDLFPSEAYFNNQPGHLCRKTPRSAIDAAMRRQKGGKK